MSNDDGLTPELRDAVDRAVARLKEQHVARLLYLVEEMDEVVRLVGADDQDLTDSARFVAHRLKLYAERIDARPIE